MYLPMYKMDSSSEGFWGEKLFVFWEKVAP